MQVIVHGGAGPLHEARHADAITGCQAATQAAWQALGDGRPALDAAEIAVAALEDNPAFNAGTGVACRRAQRLA